MTSITQEVNEDDFTPALLYQFAQDILPCQGITAYLPALGLVPSADEIAELEHQESHKRLEDLAPMMSSLNVYAGLIAKVVTCVMLRRNVEDEKTDQELVAFVEAQNTQVVQAALFAGIGQLMARGVLEYGQEVRA